MRVLTLGSSVDLVLVQPIEVEIDTRAPSRQFAVVELELVALAAELHPQGAEFAVDLGEFVAFLDQAARLSIVRDRDRLQRSLPLVDTWAAGEDAERVLIRRCPVACRLYSSRLRDH